MKLLILTISLLLVSNAFAISTDDCPEALYVEYSNPNVFKANKYDDLSMRSIDIWVDFFEDGGVLSAEVHLVKKASGVCHYKPNEDSYIRKVKLQGSFKPGAKKKAVVNTIFNFKDVEDKWKYITNGFIFSRLDSLSPDSIDAYGANVISENALCKNKVCNDWTNFFLPFEDYKIEVLN